MEDKLRKVLTAYAISEDNAIWEQIKQIILTTCRFDAREWELEYEGPQIKDGILSGYCRLVPKEDPEGES